MRPARRVKIFRWRSPKARYNNFGDELTIPLVKRLFDIDAVPAGMREAELLGAGSILDSWKLRRPGRKQRLSEWISRPRSPDLYVWGSGFILPDSVAEWPQRLHFNAVRGSLSAARTRPDATLGDPGILSSLLVDRPRAKVASVGIVPHHADTQLLKASAILPRGWAFIDPEGPVERVVTAIGSCELVVSSSLHGLITADSFGIPCIWARTVQPLYGATDFKFRDYATARRAPLNEQLSYRSVLSMSEGELSVRGTVAARELDQWQKELIDAFPEELRVKR